MRSSSRVSTTSPCVVDLWIVCCAVALGGCGSSSDAGVFPMGQGQSPIGATAGAGMVGSQAGMPGPASAAGARAAGTSALGAGVGGVGVVGTAAAGSGGITAVGFAGAGASGGGGAAATAGMSGSATAGAAGSGVPAAGAAGAVMGAAGSGAPEPHADLGKGDGSDVIAIGDSWMNLGASGIQQSLIKASGGQRYRTYAVPGTRLLSEEIPRQYTSAKSANPNIKTVVMTGGGNDIIQVPGLQQDCKELGDQCVTEVGKILERLGKFWADMAKDGVQDVIYVQYADTAGTNVDFVLPSGDGVPKRCAEVPAPLRCHRLETLDIVMGDIPDGIHPSSAAADRIGKALFDMMTKEGMRR